MKKILGFFRSLGNKTPDKQIILLEELSFLWLDDDSIIGKEEKEKFYAELAEVKFKNEKIINFWKELYDSQIFSFEYSDLVFIISKALFFLEKNFDKNRMNPQTPLSIQNPIPLGEHSLNVARTIFQKNKGLSPKEILCMVTAALCHDLGYALDGYVRHETGSLSWLESLLADKNIKADIFHITEAIQNHHERPSLKASKISKALFLANEEVNEKELSQINTSLPATSPESQVQARQDHPEGQGECQRESETQPLSESQEEQHSTNKAPLSQKEEENERGSEEDNDSKEIFLWENNVFIHPRAWEDCQRSPLFSSLKNIEKHTCVFKFEKKQTSPIHKTQSRGIYYVLDESDSLKITSALTLKEGMEDDFLKLVKLEIKK